LPVWVVVGGVGRRHALRGRGVRGGHSSRD
jgi:hypothetical protein